MKKEIYNSILAIHNYYFGALDEHEDAKPEEYYIHVIRMLEALIELFKREI